MNKNKQNLNESAVLILPVVYILHSFVIPFLMRMWVNYIFTRTSNSKLNENFTNTIQELTGLPIKVYVLKDTKSINAYHAGTKNIYITQGLMRILNEREIYAVLLHEAGHYLNNDSNRHTFLYAPIYNLIFYFILATLAIHPMITFLLFSISSVVYAKIMSSKSHKAEFLADSFASQIGYGKDLISGLEKVFNEIKKEICKDVKTKTACDMKLFDSYQENKPYSTHPAVYERKININSKDFKYTKLALKEKKIKYMLKSYFELKEIMKKIQKEIDEEEMRLKSKYDKLRKKD